MPLTPPSQLLDTLTHDSATQKTYLETQCEDLEVGLEKFLEITETKLVIVLLVQSSLFGCQGGGVAMVTALERGCYGNYVTLATSTWAPTYRSKL